MQSPTIAPLRALAIATALVASTGVAAAAMVSTTDDTQGRTVQFETASDVTDETPSTPAGDPAAPTPAPVTADDEGEAVAPGPVGAAQTATDPALVSGADESGDTVDTADGITGGAPAPISTSALVSEPATAAVAEVFALLPDPAVLTAAVTQCIDELRTLVPDVPSEIDRDAGLRGLVQGLFDGMREDAPVALPDPAAIAESIDVCVTLLQGVLPAPQELMTLFDSLAGQAALPADLTALVDQVRQLFDQMQRSEALAGIDPLAALDTLRSLIPTDDGSGESPFVGLLEALLGGLAPAA